MRSKRLLLLHPLFRRDKTALVTKRRTTGAPSVVGGKSSLKATRAEVRRRSPLLQARPCDGRERSPRTAGRHTTLASTNVPTPTSPPPSPVRAGPNHKKRVRTSAASRPNVPMRAPDRNTPRGRAPALVLAREQCSKALRRPRHTRHAVSRCIDECGGGLNDAVAISGRREAIDGSGTRCCIGSTRRTLSPHTSDAGRAVGWSRRAAPEPFDDRAGPLRVPQDDPGLCASGRHPPPARAPLMAFSISSRKSAEVSSQAV